MSITVGMVQISNSFSNQNYLPYSVGLLQSYAQKFLKDKNRYKFLLPIYTRISVADAVSRLSGSDFILFSAYVWNIRLSLEIAKAIKIKKPETVIVFGGPQIPLNSESFLKAYTFIDLLCHGEGEKVICLILESTTKQDWINIPSVSYLDMKRNYTKTKNAPRIKELDDIPSPYLEGIFDPLMDAYPNEQWLVMWETNRGCPFSCTFCDWGSATQAIINKFSLERLFKEIDWFKERKIEFVFCCDANFGILKRDLDIVKYVAKNKLIYGYPKALSVQNTKNATERTYQVQKELTNAGLNKGVTLAFQSLNKDTLKNIKRSNISPSTFQELQHRFTKDEIQTYTDLIIGLPGETYNSFINGISTVIENGQHNRIQFSNLSVLPNAEMGSPKYQKKHELKITETKIINIHGRLTDKENIYETQKLVVASKSMPEEDWVKARAFSWMTALLHFDKILQIPFILLHKIGNCKYHEIVETFFKDGIKQFPIFSNIQSFFIKMARDIQNGGPEYCLSEKWLNIWWPPDELILINLCTENNLDNFYSEAEHLLRLLLKEKQIELDNNLLRESLFLNKSLLKLPFQKYDLQIELSYNIWDFYYNHLRGIDIPIIQESCQYTIDRTSMVWFSWEDWCQEVIWYGNKKGAYLYRLNH